MTRLWLLTVVRRPQRAVTAVLVLALLTVATSASLVAGDALARLFREDALAEWGAVDVEGRSSRGPFLPDGAARLLAAEAGPGVVASAPRLELRAVARAGDRREPQAVVLGLGAEDTTFAPLPGDLGALPPGEAVLNDRLATRLGVAAGDTVALVVAVPRWRERIPGRESPRVHEPLAVPLSLRVAAVVPSAGVADLHRVPLVLLRRDLLQRAAQLSPAHSSALHLDVRQGGRDAAEDVVDRLTPTAQRLGVALAPVTEDALDVAAEEGGLFRSLLLTLAVLVLLAATAAVVELLAALALDRAADVAVLRAAGLRRAVAARLLIAEALVYAAAGAALGLLAAGPAGRLVAGALADHFAGLEDGRGREQVPLPDDVTATPLVLGVLVVVLAAVWAARSAARRVLDDEIGPVLRGDAPVGTPARSGRWVAVLAVGSLLTGAGSTAAAGGAALVFLGATLVLGALWARARGRSTDRERTDTRAALLALAWSVAGAGLLADLSDGVQAAFGVVILAGGVAVSAAAVLLARRLRAVARLLERLVPGGRARTSLLVGAAWGEESTDRSALRAATVGGALFAAAALAVLGSAQALPVDRQSGGFAAIGTAAVGVDVAALRRVPGVEELVAVPHSVVAETGYRTQRDDGPAATVPYPVRLAAATPGLAVTQRWRLAAGTADGGTAQTALDAVLRDEDKAVVDRYALPEGARVGDDVVLRVRGLERRLTLVGVLDTYLLGTVFVGGRTLDDLAAVNGATMVFARGDGPGLAAALSDAGLDQGLDVRSVEELRDDVVRVNRTFTDVFALMLLLSLAVVVVSIAAATSRAARQRRSQLGVLRALGVRRRGLVLALVVEPVLAAGLGAAVGLAAGLLVLRSLLAVRGSSLAFVLDAQRLAGVVGGTLLLVVVTAGVASWGAVRRQSGEQLADLG